MSYTIRKNNRRKDGRLDGLTDARSYKVGGLTIVSRNSLYWSKHKFIIRAGRYPYGGDKNGGENGKQSGAILSIKCSAVQCSAVQCSAAELVHRD
jgi:hypothetical protein